MKFVTATVASHPFKLSNVGASDEWRYHARTAADCQLSRYPSDGTRRYQRFRQRHENRESYVGFFIRVTSRASRCLHSSISTVYLTSEDAHHGFARTSANRSRCSFKFNPLYPLTALSCFLASCCSPFPSAVAAIAYPRISWVIHHHHHR